MPYVQELANQKSRAAAGGVQYQPQGGGQAAGGQLFQHHSALDAGSGALFQGDTTRRCSIEILDGNYDEIREWIIHGQVDCGFLSSIVADDLKFYPLLGRPVVCRVPGGASTGCKRPSVTLSQLFQYPLIIETPGCDNDIQHLIAQMSR